MIFFSKKDRKEFKVQVVEEEHYVPIDGFRDSQRSWVSRLMAPAQDGLTWFTDVWRSVYDVGTLWAGVQDHAHPFEDGRFLAECRRKLLIGGSTASSKTWFQNFPEHGVDLLHVVEDVHMQVFLTMVLYFGAVAATIMHCDTHLLQKYECIEKIMHDPDVTYWESRRCLF